MLLIALLTVTRAEGNDACQADFDGNGVVEFADFLLFSGQFGQRGGETCTRAIDADSLAVVTGLRDSISALQAALGATRFAVTQLQSTTTELQNALASETERANENQRLLTASNDAFNSLAQTRCPESEPAAPAPQPPGAPVPQPEPGPPVVIETQPEPEPEPPTPTLSLSFETTVVETTVTDISELYVAYIKVFINGLEGVPELPATKWRSLGMETELDVRSWGDAAGRPLYIWDIYGGPGGEPRRGHGDIAHNAEFERIWFPGVSTLLNNGGHIANVLLSAKIRPTRPLNTKVMVGPFWHNGKLVPGMSSNIEGIAK